MKLGSSRSCTVVDVVVRPALMISWIPTLVNTNTIALSLEVRLVLPASVARVLPRFFA